MDLLVSIIVPVYNAGPYLKECVLSVLRQSEERWELLLIDDGSTDGSGHLCDVYASQDSRIQVLHKTNGGLSDARNAGLDIASGKFVTFLDADDCLHPLCLEFLLRLQATFHSPIVSVGYLEFDSRQPDWIPGSVRAGQTLTLPWDDAVEQVLYRRRPWFISNSPCGKLYDFSLFRQIRFRKGIYYEDIDIFYRLFRLAGKITFSDARLYGYRQHPASYLHVFQPGREDVLDVTERLWEWTRSEAPALSPAAADRLLAAAFNMLKLSHRERSSYRRLRLRCKGIIRRFRLMTVCNKKARPRNRVAALLSFLLIK